MNDPLKDIDGNTFAYKQDQERDQYVPCCESCGKPLEDGDDETYCAECQIDNAEYQLGED